MLHDFQRLGKCHLQFTVRRLKSETSKDNELIVSLFYPCSFSRLTDDNYSSPQNKGMLYSSGLAEGVPDWSDHSRSPDQTIIGPTKNFENIRF